MTALPPYVPVPVQAAREIAEKYGKSIVIIFCHDLVHGMMHTTTYGTDPQNRAWAAQGGEIATRALGGSPELGRGYEDYRIEQARKLLVSIRKLLAIAEYAAITGPAITAAQATIAEAEKVLGPVPDGESGAHA